MNKSLILIRGVMGSGKSTLSRWILLAHQSELAPWESPNWYHFEADMYFINKDTGEYKFDANKLGQAHTWCQRMAGKAMSEGKNVIVSNTFIRRKEMQEYIDLGKHYEYDIQEIVCRGRFQNIHGVPEEKVKAKLEAFEL